MRRLIYLLVFLAMAIIGLSFTMLNDTLVVIDYYMGVGTISLPLLLVLTLILGMLLGVMGALGWMFHARRDLGRARREMRRSNQELENLRTMPLKDI